MDRIDIMRISPEQWLELVASDKDTTCQFCKSMDGQMCQAKYVKVTPFHPNCRCEYITIDDPNEKILMTIDLIYQIAMSECWNTNDANNLVMQYFRDLGLYNDEKWCVTAGNINPAFNKKVNAYLELPGSESISLKYLFTPYGDRIDLLHMMATMQAYAYNSKIHINTDYCTLLPKNIINSLAGWAGDLHSLMYDVLDTNCEQNYETYYKLVKGGLGNRADKTKASTEDLLADMDAVNIMCHYDTQRPINEQIAMYYKTESSSRVGNFIVNEFGSIEAMQGGRYLLQFTENFILLGLNIQWPLLYEQIIPEALTRATRDAFSAYIEELYRDENLRS